MQGVSKVRSDFLSAFISEITEGTFSKIIKVCYSFFILHWITEKLVASMASFILFWHFLISRP